MVYGDPDHRTPPPLCRRFRWGSLMRPILASRFVELHVFATGGHPSPETAQYEIYEQLTTFASDTRTPGKASDYAVYRRTQRPRRDAMSQGGFVAGSPCEKPLTRQGYPRRRSN